MATDDERRRVAERLRNGDFSAETMADVSPWGELTHIADSCMGTKAYIPSFNELNARLADLIEPAPTSSDTTATHTDATATCDVSQSCRDTVACDREALLALADELEEETGSVCGVCMGKTARRIREACGEAAS